MRLLVREQDVEPDRGTPASCAPRLAASISPGAAAGDHREAGLAERPGDLPGARVLGDRRRRAGGAEDADRGADVGQRLEPVAQLAVDQPQALGVRARRERRRGCSAQMISSPSGWRRRGWLMRVRFASGRPTTFVSPHGSIRKTTAALRRARRRRLRARPRRPARHRAARRSTTRAPRASGARSRGRGPAAAETVAQGDRDRQPGARQRGDRGQRRLRAPRARAGPRRARQPARRARSRRAPRRSPSRSPRAFGADRNDSVQAQIKEIVCAETRQQREELMRTLTAEDGSQSAARDPDPARARRCSRPRSATARRSSACASRTRRRRGRCRGRSASCARRSRAT